MYNLFLIQVEEIARTIVQIGEMLSKSENIRMLLMLLEYSYDFNKQYVWNVFTIESDF